MNQDSITTGVTSFGGLPLEVQVMVASHLNPYGLSVCVRVCKAWKTTFHPYLWRQVEIVLENSEILQLGILDALKANREYIHSLKLRAEEGDVLREFMDYFSPSSSFSPHSSSSWSTVSSSSSLSSTSSSHSSFSSSSPSSPSSSRLTFPHLTSAEIMGAFDFPGDQRIAEFLDLTDANWKSLVFCDFDDNDAGIDFGPRSREALLKHVHTLEVFRWKSWCGSIEKVLERLLCSATNLKEVSIIGNNNYNSGVELDAQKIVESDWVCSNLEILECCIRNIPRPDITAGLDDDDIKMMFVLEGTSRQSLDLQQQVYSKLAGFTKLRELKLASHEDPESLRYEPESTTYARQYDCLAMSLDSGLDLLKGLKELRVVGLEGMSIKTDGDKEQAWFKEHWPHAEILFGESSEEEDSDDDF